MKHRCSASVLLHLCVCLLEPRTSWAHENVGLKGHLAGETRTFEKAREPCSSIPAVPGGWKSCISWRCAEKQRKLYMKLKKMGST